MGYNLKDENEVKEYIENLGIEYRFGCFSEKKSDVCHLLGDYLEGIKKDFEKAGKVFRSNCDDYGYARSCLKYGHYSFVGKGESGSKGDPLRAYRYYEKGCELRDADSCLHAGLLLVSQSLPKEIQRDIPKAFENLKKSCEMNNATACFYLSGMHISGVQSQADVTFKTGKFIVAKDMKRAFEFAYKACELKNMYACANLSQMYARGDGIEKNEERAEKYKKMAMEMQNEVKQQASLEFQQGVNS